MNAHDETRAAIVALDDLLKKHPQNIERDIITATRALVHLRDRLIAMRRASFDSGQTLEHTKAVLSVLMAGHYPIEGMRWDCIKQARDALAGLTPEVTG